MTCTHARVATDNVITWCVDCGEDWTAITAHGWSHAAGGVYCHLCDVDDDPGDTSSRVVLVVGAVVLLVLFAAIVAGSLMLAGWPR